MLILKRLTPYISAAIFLALFQFSEIYYTYWYYFIAGIVILSVFTVFFLNKFSFSKETLAFCLPLFWFSLGVFAFLFFQDKELVKQIIIFSSAFIFWLYTNNIAIYIYKHNAYLAYSLENISNYLNLLTVFLVYVSSFSYFILSVARLRWVMILIFVFTYLLTWQTMWINQVHSHKFKYFSLIMAAVCTEMFWALKFWPTSYYVNGLVLAAVFFILSHFVKLRHSETLSKKIIFRYLAGSAFVLTIILATAQWT
ncbi:MAG: hypothetical protein WC752_03285 [Patescibacteria group bacterium]|jgi:hypothetical protein